MRTFFILSIQLDDKWVQWMFEWYESERAKCKCNCVRISIQFEWKEERRPVVEQHAADAMWVNKCKMNKWDGAYTPTHTNASTIRRLVAGIIFSDFIFILYFVHVTHAHFSVALQTGNAYHTHHRCIFNATFIIHSWSLPCECNYSETRERSKRVSARSSDRVNETSRQCIRTHIVFGPPFVHSEFQVSRCFARSQCIFAKFPELLKQMKRSSVVGAHSLQTCEQRTSAKHSMQMQMHTQNESTNMAMWWKKSRGENSSNSQQNSREWEKLLHSLKLKANAIHLKWHERKCVQFDFILARLAHTHTSYLKCKHADIPTAYAIRRAHGLQTILN